MKKINFLDPSIKRKSKLTDKNFQFLKNSKSPLPSEVEISESGVCNRKCSFCPRSASDFKEVKEFISPKLHCKLIDELKNENYQGVVRYSGFVEPLLDKNIFSLISEVSAKLPLARSEIVTNGDVLNRIRLKKLFKAGLSTLLISIYDGPEDAIRFEKMCLEENLKPSQYVIRHRYYSKEKDFGLTISNRAGMMENAEFKINALKEPLKEKCFYPSYTFFMDYNGDVLMCPHDWGKKIILGNLKDSTFREIWLSKKAISFRKKLNQAKRNFSPCNVCDVNGELIGKKHAKVWSKL
jgi:radical SAM protein with 4Fe4S-binding SPASM domain